METQWMERSHKRSQIQIDIFILMLCLMCCVTRNPLCHYDGHFLGVCNYYTPCTFSLIHNLFGSWKYYTQCTFSLMHTFGECGFISRRVRFHESKLWPPLKISGILIVKNLFLKSFSFVQSLRSFSVFRCISFVSKRIFRFTI